MSIAVLAVGGTFIGLGLTAYGMATAPGSPNVQSSSPSNSISYDADGNVTSTQTYDTKTNTWVTRAGDGKPTAPEKPQAPVAADFNNPADYQAALDKYSTGQDEYEQSLAQYDKDLKTWQAGKDQKAADKIKLADLRTKMIDNLNASPEDRVKAYDAYQQAYSDAAHRDIDPRFDKIDRNINEQSNATGMFGSRAYVDTKNELNRDRLNTNNDIANQAVMAKETLANNDRNFYSNMLGQIDNGARADTLASAQVAQSNANTGLQQTAATLASNGANNSATLAKWQADQSRSASYANAGTGLAGGLLYLYGKNKSGGATGGNDFAG